uniref:Uncharacterized protein n=1 Tax=Timema douglasi TaxID=61478 RepID=A0A7R8Z9R4_TIMDO|nr:unnamed protein product [Timema douglasi]
MSYIDHSAYVYSQYSIAIAIDDDDDEEDDEEDDLRDLAHAREVVLRVSHSSLMSSDRMKPRPGDWVVTITSLSNCSNVKQVLKKHEPVYQAVWANNTDFDEVLISPVMIQDHMPDNVLQALNKSVCFTDILDVLRGSKKVQACKAH